MHQDVVFMAVLLSFCNNVGIKGLLSNFFIGKHFAVSLKFAYFAF